MASWKDSLKIGVNEIDIQHKQLCDSIDNLMEACKTGKGRTEVNNTVNFLEEYIIKHFREEEALQKKSGYPKCAEHKKMHDDFIEQVADIKSQIFEKGVDITTVSTVNRILLGWLITHITRVDNELKDYVK